MKKALTLTLASALLTSALAGCGTASNNLPELTTQALGESVMTTATPSTTSLASADQTAPKEETPPPAWWTSEELIPADFSSYDSIIMMYRKIVGLCDYYTDEIDNMFQSKFDIPNEEARAWYQKVFSSVLLFYSPDKGEDEDFDSFGYTIKDLNGDGIDELILRRDDNIILTVFSMVDGKPILLDNYRPRYSCWIGSNGLLHVYSSGGHDVLAWKIYRVASGGNGLILLAEYGTDGTDENTLEIRYYVKVNGEMIYISKSEYDELTQGISCLDYDQIYQLPKEWLEFIPLYNDAYPKPPAYDLPEIPSKG